ncbi:uncharacterized protein [Epargyreus clarus]|uniref:uncharacterized protein n=1 Tax=Epargyreus clarus TaxID=520877 RepID=UPI003C2E8F69
MTRRRSRNDERDRSRQRYRCNRSNSRSRSRLRESSSAVRHCERSSSVRDRTPPRRDNFRHDSRDRTLDTILARLSAIEGTLPGTSSNETPSQSGTERHVQSSLLPAAPVAGANVSAPEIAGSRSGDPVEEGSSTVWQDNATDKIVGALLALSKVRSQNYFISPFDPSVHDFDVWSAEVDHAKEINGWDDRECLGRVGSSLRGDSKSWLNEWVTSDRSWSNFKIEFRSLCPRNIDMASILFDVMNTNSDKFATYAEYARKSLLRLNIVAGLSEDLKVAIIARGITDPHIKAVTTNAKPTSKQLVEFLSAFVKPKTYTHSSNVVRPVKNIRVSQPHKREFYKKNMSHIKCRICGSAGHFKHQCNSKITEKPAQPSGIPSTSATPKLVPSTSGGNRSTMYCSFCKRTGHVVDMCFQKQRSDACNRDNVTEVNFCSGSDPNVQT